MLETDAAGNIYRTISQNANYINVYKYHPAGTYDNTFGINGMASMPQHTKYLFRSADVKIRTDAKILIAGISDTTGPVADRIRKVFLAVFDTNGKPDSSFNQVGYKVFKHGTDSVICRRIKLQTDGKILGVGSSQKGYGKNIDLFVFRAHVDGNLDSTFGNNGFIVIDINNSSNDAGNNIELQPDGKVILSGDTKDTTGDGDQFVVRLTPDGILDNTFGNNGIFTYSVAQKGYEHSVNCKLTNDNQLVVGGNFLEEVYHTKDMFVARILLGAMTGVLDFGKSNSSGILLYPNPINTHGNFEFELAKDENISVSIVDIQGREVQKIISNTSLSKGTHQLSFELKDNLPQGTYLIVFSNGNGRKVIKFLKN